MNRPKYALPEYERRWLLTPGDLPAPATATLVNIRDRYLDGTRLRLRRMDSAAGGTVYKLCKKYRESPAGQESITNLYLEEHEFRLLRRLPGVEVAKQRHRLAAGGSIDRYVLGDDVLLVYEREFRDAADAAAFIAPAFAGREITGESGLSGAALAARFGRHQGA